MAMRVVCWNGVDYDYATTITKLAQLTSYILRQKHRFYYNRDERKLWNLPFICSKPSIMNLNWLVHTLCRVLL